MTLSEGLNKHLHKDAEDSYIHNISDLANGNMPSMIPNYINGQSRDDYSEVICYLI